MARKTVKAVYTSAGGLGHTGIIGALLENGERDFEILCGDMKEDCPASLLYPFRRLPPITEPGYARHILGISEGFGAHVLIPNHTDELALFSGRREEFGKSGVSVVVNAPEVLRDTLDKGRCFDAVARAGLPVPRYVKASTPEALREAALELGYPGRSVCFKPSRYPHGGSRGFHVLGPRRRHGLFAGRAEGGQGSVLTLDEVMESLGGEDMPELLVMEYLPGDEYSVYLLCEDGKVRYCIPNLRLELMNSFSFIAEAVCNTAVIETATAMAETLRLDYCANIQLRMDGQGVPRLVEVNPRFAGALCLSAAAGVNMPYLAVMNALGEPVPRGLKVRWGTRMVRYWKEIFIS